MRRKLFNCFAAISLLLCIATATLWVRSYWQSDLLSASRQHDWELVLNRGQFSFSKKSLYPMSVAWPGVGRPLYFAHTGPAIPFSLQWKFVHTTAPPSNRITGTMRLGFGRVNVISISTAVGGGASTPGPAMMTSQGSEGVDWLFPAWFVFLSSAFVPALWTWMDRRRRRAARRTEQRCQKCGYDLRATPDRCPECGTPVGCVHETPRV